MQDHRKLRVWKQAFRLALGVRRATEGFPKRGYGSLTDQLVRAAESVVFNIVEGCGAATQKEFARFLGVSIKSTRELEGELELAHAYGVLSERDWGELGSCTISTRRMLYRLRAKVLESIDDAPPDRKNRKTRNRKPSTPDTPNNDPDHNDPDPGAESDGAGD